MAQVPNFRRLLPEDFKDQKWIERLFKPLNKVIQDIVGSLNQSLTFKENMAADVRTLLVNGDYPMKFKWNQKSKPQLAWIGAVRSPDNVAVTAAYNLVWEYDDTSVVIKDIPGLPAGRFYVTFIVMAG